MAGYAASARLHGAEPQIAWSAVPALRSLVPGAHDTAAVTDASAIEQLELVGRPIDETIGDWLASIGESWSQLTFFLFDPESWR